MSDEGVEFSVEGAKDAQITVQLEDDTDYEVYVDGVAVGSMKTNMSGKAQCQRRVGRGNGCKGKGRKESVRMDSV